MMIARCFREVVADLEPVELEADVEHDETDVLPAKRRAPPAVAAERRDTICSSGRVAVFIDVLVDGGWSGAGHRGSSVGRGV
jgi:hypothetical protein